MSYLIDGHNLIPKLGLRLDDPEDENELIALLQEFCRLRRRSVEVYFDGAPPGHAGTKRVGLVTAHFVRVGNSADHAIRDRLKSLGRAARNWTVVSSDRQVQANARAAQAGIITSEEFAGQLRHNPQTPRPSFKERGLPPEEVAEWEKFFAERRGKGG